MTTLPDAADRARIETDLDTDLLVEAGAGSGKTTALTGRMLALVAGGTATVDQLAAVTFTRKAAGELRERFQERLEAEIRGLESAPPAAGLEEEVEWTARLGRLREALRELDRAFIGTIHSFCARLLRERPLEARLDPGFREVTQEEALRLRSLFWDGFIERRTAGEDPELARVLEVGLRPHQLRGLFDALVENPDVRFQAPAVEAPGEEELTWLRHELEEVLERASEGMPEEEPDRGWCPVQARIRELRFRRAVHGWDDPIRLLESAGQVARKDTWKATQNRWPSKGAALRAQEILNGFGAEDGRARSIHLRWLAHRYPLALALARSAAREFEEHRLRTGQLDFEDLLMQAAALLRRSPVARRELGRRYRRILVDEFQDTDPVQAEVLLLLASEPAGEVREDDPPEWTGAVPRPGQLFVVGDPKQSIYRFRRADIAVYDQVKRRFEAFGGVLHLTVNFRSTPAIARLVNGVFGGAGGFPAEPSELQAGFASMDAFREEGSAVRSGVWVYPVEPRGDGRAAVAEDDAERVASWIRGRVDRGDRSPGDFLVLTRQKVALARYARALEERNLPVQVTGAGVGIEEELGELLLLLRALADPGDAVGVVAALTGLFFGLDLELLAAHRLAGGAFDPRIPGGPPGPVREALGRLGEWWRESRVEPADVLVERIVLTEGLLPATAAGPLGSIRAGALTYLLDRVRESALAGDTSLAGALEAVALALESPEAEAPLEPGREDSVRVMNLHQAKGLEAPVVVLADPSGERERTPQRHVAREDAGARGWLTVSEPRGEYGTDLLAQPLDWPVREARERLFEEAEKQRLLYVAATRARDELWIAHPGEKRSKKSPWRSLAAWVQRQGDLPSTEVQPELPPPRIRLEDDPAALVAEGERLEADRQARGSSSHRILPVTFLARQGGGDGGSLEGSSHRLPGDDSPPPPPMDPGAPRGVGWGTAVHGVLALAASRPEVSSEALGAVGRALLLENERPVDGAGEPTELEALLEVVRSVSASSLWRRALAAPVRLVEAPFSLPADHLPGIGVRGEGGGGGAARESYLPPVGRGHEVPVGRTVVEGVVDLAFREADGWVVVDHKTDVGDDAGGDARWRTYRRQLDLYARCWEALTGEPVKERILFHVRSGRVEQVPGRGAVPGDE